MYSIVKGIKGITTIKTIKTCTHLGRQIQVTAQPSSYITTDHTQYCNGSQTNSLPLHNPFSCKEENETYFKTTFEIVFNVLFNVHGSDRKSKRLFLEQIVSSHFSHIIRLSI